MVIPGLCWACPFYWRQTRFIFFLIIALLLFAKFANAQNFYSLRKVDLPAPFKYTEVRAVRQDNDGNTWFTTSQGIWRYDGTDVQPFDINDPELPQSAVPDVVYCYDGYILLFFDVINGSRMLAYNTFTSKITKYLLDEHPVSFYKSPAGKLLIYSWKNKLWQFSGDGLLVKGDDAARLKGWTYRGVIDNVVVDKDESTYIFYQQKVIRLKGGAFFLNDDTLSRASNPGFEFSYAKDVLCSSAYLFARFPNGFIIYDKRTLKKLYEYLGVDVPIVYLSNDHFVVLQSGAGKLKPNDKLFDVQPFPYAGITGNIKTYINEPGANRILIATEKGIFELTPNAAPGNNIGKTDFITGFFKDKSVRCVYRLSNGILYAGTYKGLFVVDGDNARLIATLAIYTITQLDENTLLLGIEGANGFATLDTRTNRLSLIDSKGRIIFGFSLTKDGDGYIAGGAYNLYRLKKLTHGQWGSQLLLHSDSLGNVKQIMAMGGHWWIATSLGLFSLDGSNRLKKIFPMHKSYGVYAIQRDGNYFWLGTAANGLIKIDKNCKILSQLKFSDGLAGDFVYSLFKINSLLYAGTNQGLSVFNTNAGMQSINPPDDPQYSEELNHSAIFYDKGRQQLLFGGVSGLLFPDMDYYASANGKQTDVIKLSYVKKGSNGVAPPVTDLFAYLGKRIVLDPGYLFMGLKFSGGLESRQQNFLFRIAEIDTLWHKNNLSNEISFYGLAPGTYTLQARFPSVADRRYWLTKTIVVVPHFYQTLLFKLIIALVIGLVIYLTWLYRAREIRNEHLLRTTIASDLHDEIGSALTRISMSSELMNIKQQMDAKVVERISNDSKSAIASISDIIWSVDARNDNKDDLILRMKAHAYNMLEDMADVNFEITGLDKETNLPQLVRQNLYMIFKEAINNIARHNNNPKVWIALNNHLAGMTITIKNTIDLKNTRSGLAGQGLKNIQMRAKRMKADAEISNADGMFIIVIKMKRW
jgi:ligand-binding sensor domain-containing protein